MSELDVEAQKANVEANKAAEAAGIDTPVNPLETEEVQMAAGYYEQLRKTIRGYSSVMNGKGLARVLVAVAEFPYANSYPKFRSDAEQKLFTFMLTIQSAKAKIAEALKSELGSLENQAIDGIVAEKVEELKTIKEGETNGNVD